MTSKISCIIKYSIFKSNEINLIKQNQIFKLIKVTKLFGIYQDNLIDNRYQFIKRIHGSLETTTKKI